MFLGMSPRMRDEQLILSVFVKSKRREKFCPTLRKPRGMDRCERGGEATGTGDRAVPISLLSLHIRKVIWVLIYCCKIPTPDVKDKEPPKRLRHLYDCTEISIFWEIPDLFDRSSVNCRVLRIQHQWSVGGQRPLVSISVSRPRDFPPSED